MLGIHRAAFADGSWVMPGAMSLRLLKVPSTVEARGPDLDDITPQ